jgi:hypothetical protein
MWGYKKNGKSSNGWLVIEDSGDILVKNLSSSVPLGNVNEIVDPSLDRKAVAFRNSFGDDILVNLSRDEAQTFYRMISIKQPTPQPSWQGLIEKLAALKDAGLLTEDEFAVKKAEVLRRV